MSTEAPHRLTPVDVLAREAYDAVVLLGPDEVCFEQLIDILKSRPVLVRQGLERLLDIGLVTATRSGCFALAPRGAA